MKNLFAISHSNHKFPSPCFQLLNASYTFLSYNFLSLTIIIICVSFPPLSISLNLLHKKKSQFNDLVRSFVWIQILFGSLCNIVTSINSYTFLLQEHRDSLTPTNILNFFFNLKRQIVYLVCIRFPLNQHQLIKMVMVIFS